MGFGGFYCILEEMKVGAKGGWTHKLRERSINCGNTLAPFFIMMSQILNPL